MTIYELKKLNQANGGFFFARRHMEATGDTLKGFSVTRGTNPTNVVVTRKRNGESMIFDRKTGRVLIP